MSLSLQQLISRLSFRQMQVFQAVYRQQGYGKAAESLGLTQPAVSSQIRKLEQALGQPLFEYVGRQLYCTRAGERVAQRIQTIFEQVELLQTDLHNLQGQLSGQLSICAVSTAQYAVPHLLQNFLTLHPAVNVNIRIVNRAIALEQLNQNTDDLVLMELVPSDRSLASLPFLDNELIPVMSADHPLASRRQLSAQQFLDARLLLREAGSGSRLALEQHCQQQRLSLATHMTLGSNDAIKQGVLAGLGVAVLPKIAVLTELRSGQLVSPSIKGFPLRRSWCLVYPKGKHPTPVTQAFLSYIQSNLKSINQSFKNLLTL
jgi:DNA-binding transcriptional LysR family regulator